MAKKIKATKEQVNKTEGQVPKAEGQVPGDREAEALKGLKEEDRAEEQRLFQEVKAAMEAHHLADARWTEKQHEAAEEQSRAEELREVAKRLHGEAAVIESVASASSKRAAALAQQAAERDAQRAAFEQQWSEAVERWEKLRYALGLPFYDSEVGPPTWFTSPYEQPGLSKLFTER